MSEYQVLGEMILVKKENVKKSAGSLLVPDEARKSGQLCLKGKVVSVGTKVQDVHVGDVVFFSNYAGQYLQLEDSFDEPDLVVMREDEVLAIEIGNYVTKPSD